MRLHSIGLVAALALACLMAPLATEAQQPVRLYRIGILGLGPHALDPLFLQELHQLGYVEGQNLFVERRYADTQTQLPVLAAALGQRKVDLILTRGAQATQSAKQVTTAIPLVFHGAVDLVQNGFVASFAQPGGHLTGYVVGH